MVVWKPGTEPNEKDIQWMIDRLQDAATERFGEGIERSTALCVRYRRRRYWRDPEWLSRRWTETPSKYSGWRRTVFSNEKYSAFAAPSRLGLCVGIDRTDWHQGPTDENYSAQLMVLKEVYWDSCAACHGSDGSGARQAVGRVKHRTKSNAPVEQVVLNAWSPLTEDEISAVLACYEWFLRNEQQLITEIKCLLPELGG